MTLSSRLEDEQSLVARLQRQVKELMARVQELEEELAAERQSRAKAEKSRSEMQIEVIIIFPGYLKNETVTLLNLLGLIACNLARRIIRSLR